MKTLTVVMLLAWGGMLIGNARCLGADAPSRETLGRQVKLRILVDKVMQPEEGWTTQEWMVKETAGAGFNVLSPRRGYENLDEVRQVAEWCRKYGIYYMPWMRGSLSAPDGPQADGKRLVRASGKEQALYSPNADEFWEWTQRYILEYARISARNRNLMGVFLDYENYAPGKAGDCYDLSYDEIILGKFAKARSIALPRLEPARRKVWLDELGLHEEFRTFQINHWRERCRALRRAVDAIDPTFQLCIYPAPGTPFVVEACYPEWSSKRAPIILADPWVYGRPSRFMPQREALEENRRKLLRGREVPEKAGIPFIYVGGVDPVVTGADPEFSGKNAVMLSDTAHGYWVFYEGPTYTKQDHRDYWKWFTWANNAIAAANLKAWHEPRQTPGDSPLAALRSEAGQLRAVEPATHGVKVEIPAVRLRGENRMVLSCKAGTPVEVVLGNHPVSETLSLLVWELYSPTLAKIAGGTIPARQAGAVRFTPKSDGIYILGTSAGRCAYSVTSANIPIGLFTGDGVSLIHEARRLYFHVPAGVREFTVVGRGGGGETVRVNVFDPRGNRAATGQTTLQQSRIEVTVPVGADGGKRWSVEVTRADAGTLEDSRIWLDPKLPPILSLVQEHAFQRSGH